MQDDRQHNFSDHELVAAFIEKRLADNLAAFKQHLPDLYEKFSSYKEERFFLTYDQNGSINLFDRQDERFIYGDNAVAECLANFDDYTQNPVQRPYFVSGNEAAAQDTVNYLHSGVMCRIGKQQMSLLTSSMQAAFTGEDGNDLVLRKNFGFPSHINTIFFFSTGLGFDLEKLYLERDVRNFILAEPNSDVFYASLQLIDWSAIFEKCLSRGFNLNIIVDEDQECLLQGIHAAVSANGRHNVAGAYLYSSFYLDGYKEIFEEVKKYSYHSFLNGFGFYDDSRYSVAHTLSNIRNNVPLLSTNKKINKYVGQSKCPVFIVGNGPSLDSDIEFIKENQGKVVVVSCGTALRSLLANDIVPDFHAELERTAHVPYWIKKSADGIDNFFDKLKQITLLCASQVHPETASLFGRSGMVLKDVESGSFMVHNIMKDSGVVVMPRLAPTCVHTAISVFVGMGFKDLYFFGVDMGSTDLDVHHSKHSTYTKVKKDIDEQRYKIKAGGEIFKSNFGEKDVYASGYYPMFKNELESIVKGWKGNLRDRVHFYNCSDGALIKGVEPLHSSEIDFSDVDLDVKKTSSDVFEAFFTVYPEKHTVEVEASIASTVDSVDHVCDYAIDLINPVSSLPEVFDLIDQFSTNFHSKEVLDDSNAWLYTLFDGSLLYMLSCMSSTAMLPADEKQKLEVINNQFLEMKNFFELVKEDFRANNTECDKESRYSLFVD